MKRIIIIGVTALTAIAVTVGVMTSGGSAAPASHCVRIGKLRWCYSSTVDQITSSVSQISALTNSPGGPQAADISGTQKIVFNTPAVPGGQTTCVNVGDGEFDCN